MKWLILLLAVTNTCLSQQFPVSGYKIDKFVRKPGVINVTDSTVSVMYQVNDSLARQFTAKINRAFHSDLFKLGGINGYLCDSALVVISHKIIYVSRNNETIQFFKCKFWDPNQWKRKFIVLSERDYTFLKRKVKVLKYK